MSTETTVSNLKINKLTKAQYDTITPSATEAYELTDLSSILDGKETTLVAGKDISLKEVREYFQNNSNTKVDTGITITQDNFELDIVFYCNTTQSYYIFQSRDVSNSSILGISGSSTNATIMMAINGFSVASSIPRYVGNIYHVNAKFLNGAGTLYVQNLSTGASDTKTLNYTFAANSTPLNFFGNAGNNFLVSGNRIYSAYIKVNDVLVGNYIADMNGDTAGVRNTVTNTFLTISNGSVTLGGNSQKLVSFTNDTGYITSSAISNMQTTSNLVTSVSASSTNAQYPSAKLFYDTVGNIESALNTINSGSNS